MSKKVATMGGVLSVALALAATPSWAGQSRSRGSAHAVGTVHARVPPSGAVVGRAVPRGHAFQPLVVRSFGPRFVSHRHTTFAFSYGYPFYGFGFSYLYGYPGYGYAYPPFYGYPYAYDGVYGYRSYGYGYPYGASGYGYDRYGAGGYVSATPGAAYGGVRIQVPERDATVFIDGYYAGIVDDFDGTFQRLTLEAGTHHIEIRKPGFETLAVEVEISPGRTITYRSDMRRQ